MKRKQEDKLKLQMRINSHCISSKHSAGNIFIEETTSALAGFHTGLLSWLNWNLERDAFQEGEILEYLEKTLGAKQEPTLNSTSI